MREIRGVLAILLFVVLACSVFALNEGAASLEASSYYESVNARFTYAVSNTDTDPIGDITLTVPGATAQYFVVPSSITEPDNYDSSYVNDVNGNPLDLRWVASAGGVDDATQYFRFNASAILVDSDTSLFWEAKLLDNAGALTVYVINITILNDDTPPEIQDIFPGNGDFVKEGTVDLTVRVNATDNETGIKEADFKFSDCSGPITEKDMVCDAGVCTTTVDVSSFVDGDQVCFTYVIINNALEDIEYTGRFTVDGLAPSVELNSPEDGAMLNANQHFTFTPHDNLAPELECELEIDDEVVATGMFENDALGNFSTDDLEEGEHTWSVTCTDGVGFTNSSEERTVTLDLTAPEIVGLSPDDGSLIASGDFITFSVTDNYELDDVDIDYDGNLSLILNDLGGWSYSVDTSALDEGPFTFSIVASDAAGNVLDYQLDYTVDLTAPSIELVEPVDGAISDLHVNFVVNVTDNYDDVLDCELFVNGESEISVELESKVEENFTIMLDLGNASWYLQCEDDVGNSQDSEIRDLVVFDLSGPDVVIEDVGVVPRGVPIVFEVEITDISGVDPDSVEGTVYDAENNSYPIEFVLDSGDDYTATFTPAVDSEFGEFLLEVRAEDALGNPSSAEERFNVTYNYIIDFDLSPSRVERNHGVGLSGTIEFDNGSEVPENEIELTLPGADATVDIVDGEFSHSFTAPSSTGDYNIVASVTAENGLTYSHTEELEVYSQGGSSDDDYDDGGDHNDDSAADDVDGSSWKASGTITSSTVKSSDTEEKATVAVEVSDQEESEAEPEESKPLVIAKDEAPQSDNTRGVGGGWAVFKDFLKAGIVWWVLLLLVLIVAGLYFLSKADFSLGLYRKDNKGGSMSKPHTDFVKNDPYAGYHSSSSSGEKFRARIK